MKHIKERNERQWNGALVKASPFVSISDGMGRGGFLPPTTQRSSTHAERVVSSPSVRDGLGRMAIRKDGLRVFLDGDKELDYIRLHEPNPVKVILAVAIKVARAVARSYALKHAQHLCQDVEKLTKTERRLIETQFRKVRRGNSK